MLQGRRAYDAKDAKCDYLFPSFSIAYSDRKWRHIIVSQEHRLFVIPFMFFDWEKENGKRE